MNKHTTCGLAAVLLLLVPATARAGMPFLKLADVVRLRLQAISFFLLLVVLAAAGVLALWNFLQKDFPRLPRLSFGKALAVVTLWGLGFHLVLTMIAGGRELMTPGAWEPDGVTYRLKTVRAAPVDTQLAHARRAQLERLRTALWQYAATHDGNLPPHDLDPAIPETTWRVVDPSGIHFAYAPGRKPDADAKPVAWEPGLYGKRRFVLLANGDIREMDVEEITALVGELAR